LQRKADALEIEVNTTGDVDKRRGILQELSKIYDILNDTNSDQLKIQIAINAELEKQRLNALETQRIQAESFSGALGKIGGPLGGLFSDASHAVSLRDSQNKALSDLEASYQAGQFKNEQEYQQRMIALQRAQSIERVGIVADMFGSMGGIMGQFYEESGRKSKEFAIIQKGLMIAQTIIYTAMAATAAMASQAVIPIIGPALGITAAQAIWAVGLANVALIAAQPMHSGGDVIASGNSNIRHDEVMRTLQTGEVVLSRSDVAAISGARKPIVQIIDQRRAGSPDVEVQEQDGRVRLIVRDELASPRGKQLVQGHVVTGMQSGGTFRNVVVNGGAS